MSRDDNPCLFGNEPDLAAGAQTDMFQTPETEMRGALDELFQCTRLYKSSKMYYEMMQFIARFHFYSPFNAALIQSQMPGARYVATPKRWVQKYGRIVNTDARPLIILQPMGPVMPVFDVSDTEPTEHARDLPIRVEKPFEIRSGYVGKKLDILVENAIRDGVRIIKSDHGSQAGGSIRRIDRDVKASQKFIISDRGTRNPTTVDIPVRYDMLLNKDLSDEAQYAVIAHELGHLYCGHLGTPNKKWWPSRRGLEHAVREFEAESIAYLVCSRAGIKTESEKYLSGYVKRGENVAPISLDRVIKSVTLIEEMSIAHMKSRKI